MRGQLFERKKCVLCDSFKAYRISRGYVKCRQCGHQKSFKKIRLGIAIVTGFYQQCPAYRLASDLGVDYQTVTRVHLWTSHLWTSYVHIHGVLRVHLWTYDVHSINLMRNPACTISTLNAAQNNAAQNFELLLEYMSVEVIVSNDNQRVLSFTRGEELFESLLSWCEEKGILGATFTGLGAADQLELAYYHLPSKSYERQNIEEEVEILSLTGNVGVLKGKCALHIHGVFGKRDLSTFGGHVFKLHVSGACELHVTLLHIPLNRVYDEETGLNLIKEKD